MKERTTVQTAILEGIEARIITLSLERRPAQRTELSIPCLTEIAEKDTRSRVLTALGNSGFDLPDDHFTVTAERDLGWRRSHDLPIALGILIVSGFLEDLGSRVVVGALDSSGHTRSFQGLVAIAETIKRQGRSLVYSIGDDHWAGRVGVSGVPIDSLGALKGETRPMSLPSASVRPAPRVSRGARHPDMSNVKGHAREKRALTIAALGGFNVALVGPPASGKTMLAQRLPGILPPMNPGEHDEVLRIANLCGKAQPGQEIARPFRAPHHSISVAGIAGGDQTLLPGEVILAHRGVLCLPHLPEFSRQTQCALSGKMIDRVAPFGAVTLPAAFTLIATMLPCPCGWLGDHRRSCRCTQSRVTEYWARIQQPIRDAIDLWIWVSPVRFTVIRSGPEGETSAKIRARLKAAKRRDPPISDDVENTLADPSTRDESRLRAIAHTIAKLDGAPTITHQHLEEARQYRAFTIDYLTASNPRM